MSAAVSHDARAHASQQVHKLSSDILVQQQEHSRPRTVCGKYKVLQLNMLQWSHFATIRLNLDCWAFPGLFLDAAIIYMSEYIDICIHCTRNLNLGISSDMCGREVCIHVLL